MENLQSLSSHLEELRKRLIVSLLSIGILTITSFFLSDFFIYALIAPARAHIQTLYFFTPYEAFMAKLKVSLAGGVIASLPVIMLQLWQFAAPGLYEKEKRWALLMAGVSVFFFAVGALFAYFLVVPVALNFFLSFQTPYLSPLISLGSYLSFFISLMFLFGAAFDFPVALVGLIAIGVVPTDLLRAQRKTAIILIFIVAAILTPTTDIVSMCLLALPLWALFEGSIWVGWILEKRRQRRAG